MGSHFHDRIDYNGVAFSIELLEWDRTFSDFWGITFFTFTQSTRMFVLFRWPMRVMHGIIFLISREFPISSYKSRSRIIAHDLAAIIRDLAL